jgi:hypothetical protein
LPDRGCLRPAELAETKARKVPVNDPLGILDVGMSHQQYASGRRAHHFSVDEWIVI